jgi:intracellular sulfur oxidation DsrE/DsrF family protein
VYAYYSGHGILDMTTKIVVNTDSEFEQDWYFALESRMGLLSNYRNTYIMVVFDCCREEKPKV